MIICENCIHKEVCGLEGYYEEALKFCADKIEERPQHGEWIDGEEEIGALWIVSKNKKCSQCGWESSWLIPRNFCPNCGAHMIKETDDEPKHE